MKPLYAKEKIFNTINYFNSLLKNKTWSIRSRDIKDTISHYLKLKTFSNNNTKNHFINFRLKF